MTATTDATRQQLDDLFGVDDPPSTESTGQDSGTGSKKGHRTKKTKKKISLEQLHGQSTSSNVPPASSSKETASQPAAPLKLTSLPPVVRGKLLSMLNTTCPGLAQEFDDEGEKWLSEAVLSMRKAILAGDISKAAATASEVENKCWVKMERDGWPSPAWREAHGLSLAVSACKLGLSGDYALSLRKIDHWCIMGGPLLHIITLVSWIEPFAKRAMLADSGEDGGKGDAEQTTIPYASTKTFPTALTHPPPQASDNLPPPPPQIPRVKDISPKDFAEKFAKSGTPVILEGELSWPAMEKWKDMKWLKSAFGHRTIPLEIGRPKPFGAGYKEKLTSMRDFVDEFLLPSIEVMCSELSSDTNDNNRNRDALKHHPSDTVAYLAQHALFDQIPELMNDVVIPEDFVKAASSVIKTAEPEVQRVNAWVGTAGTVTPAHTDSYDNFLCQVSGLKYVRLFKSEERDNLYPLKAEDGGMGAQGNVSSVNIEVPNTLEHPKYIQSRSCGEGVLGPGDMLFIPCGMWHYLRAETVSWSVNFWF